VAEKIPSMLAGRKAFYPTIQYPNKERAKVMIMPGRRFHSALNGDTERRANPSSSRED